MGQKLDHNDRVLDEELHGIGVRRNQKKQEAIVSVPPSCRRGAAAVLKARDTKIGDAVRYLGPHITPTQSFSSELTRRIAAMKSSFYRLGRFWFQKGVPVRWKRCVMLCHIVNTALSGVEPFLPSPQQIRTLEFAIAALARKAMRGEASWEDAFGRRRSLTSRQ
eukprot:16928-Pyramimonas_sp.AAC.1